MLQNAEDVEYLHVARVGPDCNERFRTIMILFEIVYLVNVRNYSLAFLTLDY